MLSEEFLVSKASKYLLFTIGALCSMLLQVLQRQEWFRCLDSLKIQMCYFHIVSFEIQRN